MRNKVLSIILTLAIALSGVSIVPVSASSGIVTVDTYEFPYDNVDINYVSDINVVDFQMISNKSISSSSGTVDWYKFHIQEPTLLEICHHKNYTGTLYKYDGVSIISDNSAGNRIDMTTARIALNSDISIEGYVLTSGDYYACFTQGNTSGGLSYSEEIPDVHFGIKAVRLGSIKSGNYGELKSNTASGAVYNTLSDGDMTFDLIASDSKKLNVYVYCTTLSMNSYSCSNIYLKGMSGNVYPLEGSDSISSSGFYKLTSKDVVPSDKYKLVVNEPYLGYDKDNDGSKNPFKCLNILWGYDGSFSSSDVARIRTILFSGVLHRKTKVVPVVDDFSDALDVRTSISASELVDDGGIVQNWFLGKSGIGHPLVDSISYSKVADYNKVMAYDVKLNSDSDVHFSYKNIVSGLNIGDTSYSNEYDFCKESGYCAINYAVVYDSDYNLVISFGDSESVINSTVNSRMEIKSGVYHVLVSCGIVGSSVSGKNYMDSVGNSLKIYSTPKSATEEPSSTPVVISIPTSVPEVISTPLVVETPLVTVVPSNTPSSVPEVQNTPSNAPGVTSTPMSSLQPSTKPSSTPKVSDTMEIGRVPVECVDRFEDTTWSNMINFNMVGKDCSDLCMSIDKDSNVFFLARISGVSSEYPLDITISRKSTATKSVKLFHITDSDTYIFNNIYLNNSNYLVHFIAKDTPSDGFKVEFGVSAVDKGIFYTSSGMDTNGNFRPVQLAYEYTDAVYFVDFKKSSSELTFNYVWNPAYQFGNDTIQGTTENRDKVTVKLYNENGELIDTRTLTSSNPTSSVKINAYIGTYRVSVFGTSLTSGDFTLGVYIGKSIQLVSNSDNLTPVNSIKSLATPQPTSSVKKSVLKINKVKKKLGRPSIPEYKHGSKKITGRGTKKATAIVRLLGKIYKVKVSSKGKWVLKLRKSVYERTKKGTKFSCYLKKSGYRNSSKVIRKAV